MKRSRIERLRDTTDNTDVLVLCKWALKADDAMGAVRDAIGLAELHDAFELIKNALLEE